MTQPSFSKEVPLSHVEGTPCATFLDYWRERCAGAWAPTLKAFALAHVPSRLIPSVAIVDVIDGGRDFRYRFWGTAQREIKGYDLTGRLVSETPGAVLYQTGLAQYRRVVSARCPLAFLYETPYALVSGSGGQLAVRAPLAGEDDAVAHVVTYQNLQIDPKAWEALWEAIR